jgi:DNA-directed RNA polymerase specialized sigma24 family protein
MLRSRDIAQIALRDTLVAAEAHIARLADPGLLGPWLYALARAECRRRRAVEPALADEAPARPGQGKRGSRLMAWNAATSLAASEFEALDLFCRHDVDLGLVLGLPAEDVRALLNRARQHLEQALGAEILVSRRSDACLVGSAVMGHRADGADGVDGADGSASMTPEVRARVLGHAARCPACRSSLPRDVSAAQVFARLPAPALSAVARAQVLGFFDDHRHSAYREFVVSRTAALDESGFPLRPDADATALAPRARLAGAPFSGVRFSGVRSLLGLALSVRREGSRHPRDHAGSRP